MTTVYEVAVTDIDSYEFRGLFAEETQANVYAKKLAPLEGDSHSSQRVQVLPREILDNAPEVVTVWTIMGELEFQDRDPFVIADVYELDHPDCPTLPIELHVHHWTTTEMHSVHVTGPDKDEALERLKAELKKLSETN